MSDAASPETEPRADAPNRATGPRTEVGKRRSRHNARVHGLTAALPDNAEEAALARQMADHWAAELAPGSEAEEAIIRASAAAFARVERARRVEEASLRSASREAVERWEKKRRHAARRRAQEMQRDPSNTVAGLEADAFGCEWLIRQWIRLDARLAQGLRWDGDALTLAMNLLGCLPQAPGPDGEPAVRRFWHLARVASGYPDAPQPGLTTDPAAARIELRRLVAIEREQLEVRRLERWEHHDGPEAEAVAQAGQIDTSKEGQLRQRYRREAYSEMLRGLNQVMRLGADRRKAVEHRHRLGLPEPIRFDPPPAALPDATHPTPDAEVAPPSPKPTPAPTPTPTPTPGNGPHRNEPPHAAETPEHDRPKPLPERDLRDGHLPAAADPSRRTATPSPSSWQPIDLPRVGHPDPIPLPGGLQPAPAPASPAG